MVKNTIGENTQDFNSSWLKNGQNKIRVRNLMDEWEKQVEEDYYSCFAPDGFFWGQQFQEEQVKEYKAQDKEAIDWCKAMLEKGETVQYSCSW
jgi:glutathione S-transferase